LQDYFSFVVGKSMNISVFICEINASAGVFSVQFPELQAFMGPQFGNFARSDQLPGEPRPRFNTQRKVWTCSLRDIAAVNAFLCSLSGATFYIGSRSSCTVETQTPDSFEDDAVAIAAEAAAARASCTSSKSTSRTRSAGSQSAKRGWRNQPGSTRHAAISLQLVNETIQFRMRFGPA
jgi:hypothetical protein